MKTLRALLALLLCLPLWLPAEVAVPELQRRVTDLTATLTVEQVNTLENQLRTLEQDKGSQVAVLMVPSTGEETIFDYGMRVVEHWRLGRQGVDDGVLLLIAKNDRKTQILVGRGLEGALPDITAKRILQDLVRPRLRDGDFDGGIRSGVDAIGKVLAGEALPPPAKRSHKGSSNNVWLLLFAAAFLAPILRQLFGRTGGSLVGGGLAAGAGWFMGGLLLALGGFVLGVMIMLLLGSGRMGGLYIGGGGGWGGGGGGFSGGGGDFGGGGASGDW